MYLDKLYQFVKKSVEVVVNSKKIHGLILESPTGLGKTYNVIKVLQDMGYKMGEQFAIISGYTTPLELYQFLYDNSGKIVILDDVTTIFEGNRARGILLSALFHPSGKRIVSYMTTSDKLDVPESFEFKGKIIWCVNYTPKNIDNIKSRCIYYPFNFTREQLIKIMYEIAEIKNIDKDVIDFIKNNTNESVRIDLRLPLKIQEIKKNVGDRWKEYAKEIFARETDEELKILLECLENSKTVKEAFRCFNERTGASRATFFRKKKLLEAIKGKKFKCV